jgi:hypothetical protein
MSEILDVFAGSDRTVRIALFTGDPHDAGCPCGPDGPADSPAFLCACYTTPDSAALERVRLILDAAVAGQYARHDTGSMDFGRGIAFLAQLVRDALVEAT